jgi:hypothetical protein
MKFCALQKRFCIILLGWVRALENLRHASDTADNNEPSQEAKEPSPQKCNPQYIRDKSESCLFSHRLIRIVARRIITFS